MDSSKNLKNCHPERSEGSAVCQQPADSSSLPNAATVAAMQAARDGGLPTFQAISDLLADLNSES
jgi:hypothetical protein